MANLSSENDLQPNIICLSLTIYLEFGDKIYSLHLRRSGKKLVNYELHPHKIGWFDIPQIFASDKGAVLACTYSRWSMIRATGIYLHHSMQSITQNLNIKRYLCTPFRFSESSHSKHLNFIFIVMDSSLCGARLMASEDSVVFLCPAQTFTAALTWQKLKHPVHDNFFPQFNRSYKRNNHTLGLLSD